VPSQPDAIPVAVPDGWPRPVTAAAYHGLAGGIAQTVAPHTEADPIGILGQLLVAYGTLIGRGAHRLVGATEHHSNEFAVLIGPSAKGRKGTSWDVVEMFLRAADPAFAENRIHSGLSSGEGLIWAVRDRITDHAGKTIDTGVADKRTLFVEGEFALVLRVLAREGNTLSAITRNAWDGKNLQTLTKNMPAKATRPHIGVIGHISADELLRYVNATELANGFLNRFLLLAVRRTQMLPDGGQLACLPWRPMLDQFTSAVAHGRATGTLTLTDAARDRWRRVYPHVSADQPGLFGSATARAEAHVVRLSLLYALLDQDTHIDVEHIDAAVALWEYAARTAHWIFGDTLGDPVADDIWQALRQTQDGLTKSEIRDLFSRNKSAKAINAGIETLIRAGRLQRNLRPAGERGGRPAEIFHPRRYPSPPPDEPATTRDLYAGDRG
jgi:hypothetical protein